MRKFYTIFLAVLLSANMFAQAPQKMSYQAVIRNASDQLVTTQVGMKISILRGASNGTQVYTEIQTPTPNANGLITIEIGGGNPSAFEAIDWSAGLYFIKTETATAVPLTNYTITGTSQLMSVPYALYAKSASTPNLQDVTNAGDSVNSILDDTNRSSLYISTIGGNNFDFNYYGIYSKIAGTNGHNRAIYGISNGVSIQRNYGLFGVATNSKELNTGVYGNAHGLFDNYGVWGTADSAINKLDNRGVMGYANGTTATGCNYGVTGWAGNSDYFNVAVGAYAEESTSTNGDNYGVSARASSVTSTGTNYGIYSEASNGAVNYAGFFNGNVTITGTLIQPSDLKLKRDINPIPLALDKINSLKPVSFYYNSTKSASLQLTENLQYGFVAQDMEQIFPNLVSNQVIDIRSTGKGRRVEGGQKEKTVIDKQEFKGINYNGLIAVLTQGIKEQQELIKQIQEKNDELEARIKTLEELK